MGWQCSSLGISGIGKYLSYRQYSISEPTTFTIEPSEPVVYLGILVGTGTFPEGEGNRDGPMGLRWDRIFWLGERPIEFTLPEGEHYYLDLFVRPESLSHLSDRGQIMDLLEHPLSASRGDSGGMACGVNEETDSFLGEMLEELDMGKTTAERFGYLCDCLILKYLGEHVEVTPPEKREENDAQARTQRENVKRKYVPSMTERSILDPMVLEDRQGLEKRYHRTYKNLIKLKGKWRMQESRNRELRTIRSGLQDQFAGGRAELHMKVARFLAKAHRKGGLDSRTATLVRRGIVRACDIAFGLRPPSGTEMDFYSQWTSRPPHLGAMDLGSPADFLSFMFPEGAIDSEPDLDPVRGTNLLIEQVRETFGFGHMSDFTGRTAGDRPIEVVETYKRLTERFVDTLRADGEGITRSNIIRELDAAYENDDLVSLLQIEVENLGGDPGFLVGMDDARLKLTIIPLRRHLSRQPR